MDHQIKNLKELGATEPDRNKGMMKPALKRHFSLSQTQSSPYHQLS
jgi:hypothetical protein